MKRHNANMEYERLRINARRAFVAGLFPEAESWWQQAETLLRSNNVDRHVAEMHDNLDDKAGIPW